MRRRIGLVQGLAQPQHAAPAASVQCRPARRKSSTKRRWLRPVLPAHRTHLPAGGVAARIGPALPCHRSVWGKARTQPCEHRFLQQRQLPSRRAQPPATARAGRAPRGPRRPPAPCAARRAPPPAPRGSPPRRPGRIEHPYRAGAGGRLANVKLDRDAADDGFEGAAARHRPGRRRCGCASRPAGARGGSCRWAPSARASAPRGRRSLLRDPHGLTHGASAGRGSA